MPEMNQAALDFLLTRRSRPAKTLTAPVPSHDALMPLLTAAARSPDHGKLEPWRFIVLEGAAMPRLAALVEARGQALGVAPEQIAKMQSQFGEGNLVVAVISAPVASDKVPEIEQVYSAGAVCLALLNAALAAGWGANWLSGWASHDRGFLAEGLGLADGEHLVGFVHIGTETVAPPERPRPELETLISWVST